jgi:hypothetical protein
MRGVGNGASLRLSACGYCVHTSRSRWWRARAADTGVFPPRLRGRVREGGGGKRRTQMKPQLERAKFEM